MAKNTTKQVPKLSSPVVTPPTPEESEECEDTCEAFCHPGDIIDERFRVVKLLKEGGFGQVYEASDMLNGDTRVAVKLESRRCPSPLMDIESAVLQRMQGTRHAPVLCGAGRVSDLYNYIAMQLLGQNLSKLRRSCPLGTKRFSLPTVVRLVVQCLAAIKDLHSIGYVHRDIKGSNFAKGMGGSISRTVFLLDYGLVRLHLDGAGKPVPERAKTGFRGTIRYAAIAVHERKDAGRKDDMWSLLYTVVEWFTGRLPWASDLSRNAVYQTKLNTSLESLCQGLPDEMLATARHIGSLTYADKPDYGLMDGHFRRMASNRNIPFEGPLDWEDNWKALKDN